MIFLKMWHCLSIDRATLGKIRDFPPVEHAGAVFWGPPHCFRETVPNRLLHVLII